MKRFIRYLYEYEQGKRLRNVGFVKVEQGDDDCTLHIHGKGLHMKGERKLQLYLFYGEDECMGIWQGIVDNVNPAVNYRLYFTREDVITPENFDKVNGIILEGELGHRYAAVWNEGSANVGRMRVLRPDSMQDDQESTDENMRTEPREEMGSESKGAAPPEDTGNGGRESIPPEETGSKSKGEMSGTQGMPDGMQPHREMQNGNTRVVLSDGMREVPARHGGMPSCAEMQNGNTQAAVETQRDRNGVMEGEAAGDLSGRRTEGRAAEDGAGGRNGRNKAGDLARGRNEGRTAEDRAKENETEDRAAGRTEAREAKDRTEGRNKENEAGDRAAGRTEGDGERTIRRAQENERQDETEEDAARDRAERQRQDVLRAGEGNLHKQEMDQPQREGRCQQEASSKAPEDGMGNGTEDESPCEAQRHVCSDQKDQKAENHFRCTKIQRNDLAVLPRCEWKWANNSFLLHGYYNYHHLAFIDDGEKFRLGVPGIYHPQEAKAASTFGFTEFIPQRDIGIDLSEDEKSSEDQFGYWCRPIKRPLKM